MSDVELKETIEILGGQDVLRHAVSGWGKKAVGRKGRGYEIKKGFDATKSFEARDDRTRWTPLIRAGIPSEALESTARRLGVSLNELSQDLGLPARTMHRRVEKGERLSPEETERIVRVARALAKAQELLGEENGRAWLLDACRGLGGEIPITLLDTADGFTAVIDELGRLEYGVIS
jgi:putative toxin-antitoxin system antitoxin component (TIGR02293 family)